MRETIECLRSIFTGARVEYSGRHVNSRGFRLRGAAPDTRIALGAFGPGMIRLAAQHADEVVLNLASPFRVGRVRAAIDSAAAAAGRAAPRLTVWVPVAVNPGAAAHSQLAAQLAVYLAPPGYGEMFSALGFDGLVRSARSRATRRELAVAVPSELLDRVCALGSPDRVAARLRAYADAGADCVAVVPATAEDPGGRVALRALRPGGLYGTAGDNDADGNLDRDGGVAMSGGLFGLLDHVAVLARLAAASIDDIGAAAGRATAKAAGVVIDDTAVTPQYVHRITAERELPIIKRIAIGSVRNKLLLILPGALLLSQLVPWLLTPLLMLGATYLCYEGAEKVCGVIGGRGHDAAPQVAERELVAGAIRTDFILSAEIMVIALNEVADQPFVPRLIVLVIVALVITAAVYGVVAVIVQMDDVGLRLTQTASRFGQRIGGGLVAGMPKLLSALSAVGMGAMLWVGGHIVLVGSDHLGWHAPYRLVHHLDDHLVGSAGGALTWLVSTAACAATGLVIGIVVVALVHLVCFRPPRSRSL